MEGKKDRIQLFLTEPSNFFKKINQESLGKAVLIYIIAYGIALVASYLMSLTTMFFSPMGGMMGVFSYGIMGFLGIFVLAIGLGLSFVFGAVTHFVSKVGFGGVASYGGTMKVLFYSSIPGIILMFTPLSLFVWIYTLILATIGIATVHRIHKGKSFFAVISPVLFIIILIVALFTFITSRIRF